ncbi:hypothetical protein D3C76_1786040 [compost metagenome]
MHNASIHGHIDQHRGLEEETLPWQALASGQDACTFCHGVGDQLFHLLQLSWVCERPHLSVRVQAITNS